LGVAAMSCASASDIAFNDTIPTLTEIDVDQHRNRRPAPSRIAFGTWTLTSVIDDERNISASSD
jgi:hypothetical protein